MKHRIIQFVAVALGLFIVAGQCLAADAQPQKGTAATGHAAKAPAKKARAPEPVLVDINSASREELRKLPGIGDKEADRIIAGRPYLTKAHLQTHNIVSPLVFQGLRDRVVARQKDAKFAGARK